MARVKMLLKLQWRAYWRGLLFSGRMGIVNLIFLTGLSWLIITRLPNLLRIVGQELARAESARLELVLLILPWFWLLLLFDSAYLSINIEKLAHYPLTIAEMFAFQTGSFLIPPTSWVLLAGTITLLLPLARAPHPLIGIVAIFCFLLAAAGIGAMLYFLLKVPFTRRLLFVVLLASTIFIYPIFADGGETVLRDNNWLLILPHIAARAATAANTSTAIGFLVLLAAIAALALLMAGYSFYYYQRRANNLATRTRHLSLAQIFPGRFGGLIHKEQRYWWRLVNSYFGLLLALAYAISLIYQKSPAASSFYILIIFIFVPHMNLTMNNFGADTRAGFSRYNIFPLDGREIVLSKNLACAFFIWWQSIPILILGGWRLGLARAVAAALEILLLMAAYFAYGNITSLHYPYPMNFYGPTTGGPIMETLVCPILCSLPTVIYVYWLINDDASLLAIVTALLTVSLYWLSLAYAGKHFEKLRGQLQARLQ